MCLLQPFSKCSSCLSHSTLTWWANAPYGLKILITLVTVNALAIKEFAFFPSLPFSKLFILIIHLRIPQDIYSLSCVCCYILDASNKENSPFFCDAAATTIVFFITGRIDVPPCPAPPLWSHVSGTTKIHVAPLWILGISQLISILITHFFCFVIFLNAVSPRLWRVDSAVT